MSTTVSSENAEKLAGKARFSHDAVANTLQTPENYCLFNFSWRSVRVDQKNNTGGLADVRIECTRVRVAVVERTHQRSVVRLLCCVDGLDAGRVRLHGLSPDHGADRAGIWGSADRRDRNLLGHVDHAPGRRNRVRLV